MNHAHRTKSTRVLSAAVFAALSAALLAGLAGCGAKGGDKPGQALASVNGAEITVLQLNEELLHAGVGPAQQEAASKQLLQVLIDRQLLQAEATREKLDRDPKVMQAVERARATIVAQEYLRRRLGTPARPGAAEVQAYFAANPQFFAQRKQFSLNELVIASADLTPALKDAADAARSLDDVAAWMAAHKVRFARTQVARSTADLNAEMAAAMLAMPKNKLFFVKEGERSLLIAIADIREAPVPLEVAAQQIEQFLAARRGKEAVAAELSRLRASARIDYLNKTLAQDAAPAAAAAASAPAPADTAATAALERGVAGLK
ncbi:MAG: EpsD family peptidyl-prolyl cis-trans isomerase [Pseudomonadota bacterium]|nr:EpsD family peptidyl-prolyl cis-trans isomerase [Pseudomonadota bacterium]